MCVYIYINIFCLCAYICKSVYIDEHMYVDHPFGEAKGKFCKGLLRVFICTRTLNCLCSKRFYLQMVGFVVTTDIKIEIDTMKFLKKTN